MKHWFTMRAAAEGVAEIEIYDEIGAFGVSARDFAQQLQALTSVETINLRIHSPGGQVFDSLAIYNQLKRHPASVNVSVDGLAASGASVIAMAGDHIVIPENAFLMVHDPIGGVVGNADEMRDVAEVLDKTVGSIVSIYAARSGQEEARVRELMADETWLRGTEAVDLGFADEAIAERQIAAVASWADRFEKPPQALQEPVPSTTNDARAEAMEIVDKCSEHGWDHMANTWLKRGLSPDEVDAKIEQANTIRDLCWTAGMSGRCDGFVRADMPVEQVRSAIFDQLLDHQSDEITAHVPPETSRSPHAGVDAADIYAHRRGHS